MNRFPSEGNAIAIACLTSIILRCRLLGRRKSWPTMTVPVTEKLTTDDPAEDLTSDEVIAIFN